MDYGTYIIESEAFKILDKHEEDRNITYILEPIEKPFVCPQCKSADFNKHGVTNREARDLNVHGYYVGLIISGHRYKCKNCGNTWSDKYSSIDERAKMTNRMRKYICEKALKKTFSDISEELSISVPTVKQIFEDHVASLDAKRKIVAPRVLGLDETHLNNIYRGVYVDIENKRIIDMTADRKLTTVKQWLRALPEKDRIDCVTMDMWGPYKDAVTSELPGVPMIIDKFHVIKHLNEALDSIRKQEQDKLTAKERTHTKRNRWLLLTNKDDLKGMDVFKLQDLLYSFPQFKEPHQLKEDFRDIYKAGDRDSAELMFEEWAEKACKYKQYKAFIEMVNNWHTEIFNYFDYEYTNAATESLNRVSKEVSAKGRGYKFEVLRAKMIYATTASKPPKYTYYQKQNEYFADVIPGNSIGFAMATYRPEKQHKRIDVGAGVDIDELLDILEHSKEF